MGPINSLPLGFLDLFGLKQLGKNLHEVMEHVQPTIDVSPYYAAYKRVFINDTSAFAAAATDSRVVATVPTGQYWFIVGGLIAPISGAAATGRGGVRIESQGVAVFASAYTAITTAAVGENLPLNFETSLPIVLQPGDVIYKTGYGMAGAGSEALAVRLCYLPLFG